MEIKLKKVHTSKDVTLSVITVAVGIGLFFLNTGLGAFIAACGILMLLFWKGGYKREGDNTLLQKKAFDVSHACRESLKGFLETKTVPSSQCQPKTEVRMKGDRSTVERAVA